MIEPFQALYLGDRVPVIRYSAEICRAPARIIYQTKDRDNTVTLAETDWARVY